MGSLTKTCTATVNRGLWRQDSNHERLHYPQYQTEAFAIQSYVSTVTSEESINESPTCWKLYVFTCFVVSSSFLVFIGDADHQKKLDGGKWEQLSRWKMQSGERSTP